MSVNVIFRTLILLSAFLIVWLFTSASWNTGMPGDPAPHTIFLDGCSGILGENIFTEGDFGTGASNVVVNNPNIAPGYTYRSSNLPPPDGFYVLTNNTGDWSNLYGTWMSLGDNSSDPNGYMMVVNASYDPGIFYEQTVSNLCENTTYEFTADVINLIQRNVTGHIRPDVTFLLNDEIKFTSGPIPQDEAWKTYGFTFTTGPDESTVKLTIRNNAPGGIGNDLALDNITFRACGPEAVVWPESVKFICLDADSVRLDAQIFDSPYPQEFFEWEVSEDDGLNWQTIPNTNGPSYTIKRFDSGRYYYRFALAGSAANLTNDKCRVYSRPKEVIVVPLEYEIFDTICIGASYQVGNSTYSQTGFYVDSLISSIGCDSIVSLHLTVMPDPNIQASFDINPPSCFGSSDASLVININNPEFPPYQYALDGVPGGTSPGFGNLSSGSYTTLITDRFGCFAEQQVSIIDPPPLEVDLGADLELTLGQIHTFQPQINPTNVTYQWSPDTGLDCTDCPSPTLQALESNQYTLKISGDAGCSAQDSILVQVNKNYRVFIPNVFSPNGDGKNDFFTILSDGLQVEIITHLRIFDRWGNMVFESSNLSPDDPSLGWDGHFQSSPVANGVYIYQAEIRFIDGYTEVFSGDVSLIR